MEVFIDVKEFFLYSNNQLYRYKPNDKQGLYEGVVRVKDVICQQSRQLGCLAKIKERDSCTCFLRTWVFLFCMKEM